MAGTGQLGVRWTVGDVSPRGFEALRLSIRGAWKVFGPAAAYAVCVNSVAVEEARARTGAVPSAVAWHAVEDEPPAFLREHLDAGMAEGVAWKFAPLRLFPDRFELALDNDCILWAMPRAIGAWLEAGEPGRCLLAEDVRAGFGRFAALCGPEPRNSGIRGVPPGFDLEGALRATLDASPGPLASELDEQGLQVAALSRNGGASPPAVSLDEVTICSPFPMHLPHLGRCGAHFVGLNVRHVPWEYQGRPGADWLAEHWEHHAGAVERAIGRHRA